MKCKVCSKDIFKHTKSQVEKCIEDAGFSMGKDPYMLMSQVGMSVRVTQSSKTITYDGKPYPVEDINEALFQFCLLGENIKASKKETPKPVEEKKQEPKDLFEE